MKIFALLSLSLCLLLCSCSIGANDPQGSTTPPDAAQSDVPSTTNPAQVVPSTTNPAQIVPSTSNPAPGVPDPAATAVYDTLKNFFSGGTQTGKRVAAVVVPSAYDLLDVYRYIVSEDAHALISLRDETVTGSAYNDYLSNTYTAKFFGPDGRNADNYLIAVAVRSDSSRDRYSVTATADGSAVTVSVQAADPAPTPQDDGGYFIFLVPVPGRYTVQQVIVK